MDCKKLQQRIDELISSEEMNLNNQEQLHIDNCQICQKYLADAEKANQLIHKIQQWEPVLDNPEALTDSIMSSIPKQSQKLTARSINFRATTRILAAAVVALLFALGIEQYMVLNKLQQLETRLSKVQNTPHQYGKHYIHKTALVNTELFFKKEYHGFSMAKASVLFGLYSIKDSNFTFSDLQRYMNKDSSIKSAFNKSSHY
jgi:hypothetical protein